MQRVSGRANIYPQLWLLAVLTMCVAGAGCLKRSSQPEVIVYTALDREFSEPIFDQFEKDTGIRVRANFDSESTKTVGLTTKLIAESQRRVRCDVFWNNEIVNTLRLEELGLLQPYQPPQIDAFPAQFRSTKNHWHGFAARARVLIVNTNIVSKEKFPKSIYDLASPEWKGKIGIAKPLFGTTATQAVCLFEVLGEEKARDYYSSLLQNEIQILSGNKQVAQDVATGKLAFGLTDTDDAIIELEKAHPVAIVYPDSAPDQLGTLFIPNTLSIQKGAPHQETAQQLLDYLMTAKVEKLLAASESAQIPLHKDVQIDLRVESPNSIHAMDVDFESAAKRWDMVGAYLKEHFTSAKHGSPTVK